MIDEIRESREAVSRSRSRRSCRRSALAQEQYGWLSREALRAGRRGARPDAGVLHVGRELLRHVPPRARRASTWSRSARTSAAASSTRRRCSRRSSASSASRPGETTAGRRGHAARRRVPRRLLDADDRRRRPPLPRSRSRPRTCPAIVAELAQWLRRRSASSRLRVVLDGAIEQPLTDIDVVPRGRRLRAARARARDVAARRHRSADPVEPARPRRRVLPDGPQGELHPDAGQGREADLPHGQRRRVGARDVQGPRDHAARPAPAARGLPDRGARDPVEARLHLHPRRVLDRVRRARGRARGGARRRAARRRRRS